MLVLKGLFGGSLKRTSEIKNKTKNSQKILRVASANSERKSCSFCGVALRRKCGAIWCAQHEERNQALSVSM